MRNRVSISQKLLLPYKLFLALQMQYRLVYRLPILNWKIILKWLKIQMSLCNFKSLPAIGWYPLSPSSYGCFWLIAWKFKDWNYYVVIAEYLPHKAYYLANIQHVPLTCRNMKIVSQYFTKGWKFVILYTGHWFSFFF